jgi:hypothetical protein
LVKILNFELGENSEFELGEISKWLGRKTNKIDLLNPKLNSNTVSSKLNSKNYRSLQRIDSSKS